MTTESAASAGGFGGSIEELDPSIGEFGRDMTCMGYTTTYAPRARISGPPYASRKVVNVRCWSRAGGLGFN